MMASYCCGGSAIRLEFGWMVIERSGARFLSSAASTRAARWRASLPGIWWESRNSRAAQMPGPIASSHTTAKIAQSNRRIRMPLPGPDVPGSPRRTSRQHHAIHLAPRRRRNGPIAANRRRPGLQTDMEGLRLGCLAAGNTAVVVEHGREPSLGLFEGPALACRILLHLVAFDLAHAEIVAVGVREIKTGHGRPWPHGEALGQLDRGCRFRVEQAEQGALLGVVGLGRIAGRRANAAVFLRNQSRGGQLLTRSIPPELAA